MFDSLRIQRFRCYADQSVTDLRRVNIIVGRNASGKTALLESIFLASGGHPEIALRLRTWRGLGDRIAISSDPDSTVELWSDLFYRFDKQAAISIELKRNSKPVRSIKITHSGTSSITVPLGDAPVGTFTELPIQFEWQGTEGRSAKIRPRLTEEGVNFGTPVEGIKGAYFGPGMAAGTPQENAARYSELSKRGEESDFSTALQREFPLLSSLSLEVNAGTLMLYAKVKGLDIKTPLGVVSAGVNRLASVLLAIANSKGGVVLIDEVENGFYFDRLQSIWDTLLRFAETYNVQLFVSTHSREAIAAAQPALEKSTDKFALLRTERTDSGDVRVKHFAGKDFLNAIAESVEIR